MSSGSVRYNMVIMFNYIVLWTSMLLTQYPVNVFTTKRNGNYVKWRMYSKTIMVIISQCICIWNHQVVCLNFHSFICQLHSNKTEKKKKNIPMSLSSICISNVTSFQNNCPHQKIRNAVLGWKSLCIYHRKGQSIGKQDLHKDVMKTASVIQQFLAPSII